jgi:Family of unknown function (DUF5675)
MSAATFRIVRDKKEPVNPTMGQLFAGDATYQTLEPPWVGNEQNISCIPIGVYPVRYSFSHDFGRMMPHIENVPNRSTILLHPGNVVANTRGCVEVGAARNTPATLAFGSRRAFEEFNLWLTQQAGPLSVEISYAESMA